MWKKNFFQVGQNGLLYYPDTTFYRDILSIQQKKIQQAGIHPILIGVTHVRG